jgi:leucyl aminopeptidase
MTNMKSDKGGAIALYGFADILAKRSGDNKVVLYLAFAENMINQDSYRPDDVVVQKNGVTAHIKNTDAEGRVVIHDSLTLAQEENPDFDEIFSIATLTGAAVYQFGNEAAGMVSKNEKLFEPFYEKGKIEDEVFCEARLHKFMLNGINDEVADISNTGTPNQGCQKAGLYLMSSIQKKNIKKYIHLDIAGPTFVEKPFGTNPIGATGFGVRTLFEVYK